ncbi:hypothetical protein [Flavobacterium wongokense]|uniref:hypothetical protein n=1 Tax=Flavobacterium wongokense TaxID=2910674 RepID=UPI001F1F722C|nr:hypothetical protein [Flavobacterium sp. WG47]MCF6132541.1 hypothetical protein [Flavobacterium sp. WG47]
MKQLLKNIFLFACVLLVVISVLQIALSIRTKGKSISGYDTLDLTANVNADLVFLGSSRGWAHFDPGFFEKNYHLKSVNIGMNGFSEILVSELRLKNYLSKNKSPKFVILNIDPFIKAGNLNHSIALTNKNDYAHFAFMPSKENMEMVDFYKFDNFEKYIPLYAIFKYKILTDCITLRNANAFPEGYEANVEKWDTIKDPVNTKAKQHYIKDAEIPNLENALRKLNAFCKSKNIKLICIQTPVYKSAYDAKAFEIPKQICQKLNIPFVDACDEKIISNIDNFYNTIHLNKNGVAEMNKLLKNGKELDTIFKINP